MNNMVDSGPQQIKSAGKVACDSSQTGWEHAAASTQICPFFGTCSLHDTLQAMGLQSAPAVLPQAASSPHDQSHNCHLPVFILAYLQVPIITTVAGAKATTTALKGLKSGPLEQVPLQDYFPKAAERSTIEFKL